MRYNLAHFVPSEYDEVSPMPYIKQITIDQATGLVKKELEKAVARAGRVWNIVQIMSLNGRVMKSSMEMYKTARDHVRRVALDAAAARDARRRGQQGQPLPLLNSLACA